MRRNPAVLLAALAGVLLGAAAMLAFSGPGQTVASHQPGTPTADSADAGFARDMATHHAQAVDLAERIRSRSTDPTLLGLAGDISLNQELQIGRMQGWLDEWNLAGFSDKPAMAWMGMGGQPMPGLAGAADVAQVSSLPIADAERRFLELMIVHHRGGVAMARAATERATRSPVVTMARGIVESQSSELDLLARLLTERGGTVPPDSTGIDMGSHSNHGSDPPATG